MLEKREGHTRRRTSTRRFSNTFVMAEMMEADGRWGRAHKHDVEDAIMNDERYR